MSLDYFIDHKVEYIDDSEYPSLYKWCIRELDADGKQLGPDWIPCDLHLRFRTQTLKYNISIEESKYNEEKGIVISEHIHTDLVSYGQNAPVYKMIGCDRAIKNIHIFIYKSDEHSNAYMFASPSYMGGTTFHEKVEPDFIQFDLYLPVENFDRFVTMVKLDSVSDVIFTVKYPDGFYSEWTPDIFTDCIKVLSYPENHNLVLPDDKKDLIPGVGKIAEYDLSFETKRSLFDSSLNNSDEDGGKEDNAISVVQRWLNDQPENTSTRTYDYKRLEVPLTRLRFPLWLIALLLIIIAFKV